MRGLGHAVVNHFGGNLNSGFAGDEHDSSPVFFAHAGEIVAGEAHTAHDVGFEEARPIFIGNFFEGLGLEDAHVVD